jgi:hypothetical protein
MAEVMEKMEHPCHEKYASNAKGNAGLTLGIIGTSLAGLLSLGALGKMSGLPILGGGCENNCGGIPQGTLYNERKETQDYIELTKQYYEGQIATNNKIDKNFFDLYKFNVDNSFALYKGQVENSFALYKGQRDQADAIYAKIADVEKKVDIMGAIRPYQDALINAKIDNVALVGDFNLARRTCKMITGELVLPSTPTVTGYASYNPCNFQAASTGA